MRQSPRFGSDGGSRITVRDLVAAMLDGMKLRCPSCSEQPLYRTKDEMYDVCPRCGAPFERKGEGDFVGAVLMAYSVGSLLVITVVFVLNLLTTWSIWTQLGIASVLSAAIVIRYYRNLKGIWVAILIALLKW